MGKVFIFAAIVSLSFITLYLPLPFQSILSAKDLTIGINTPLSGAAAPTGLGLLRALELSAEDLNAVGGIKVGKDSYTIKLITYENKYDAKEAVAAVNRLIYNDKVKYIATTGGTCVIAVNPLITENKIFHIGYTYGGKKATNPSAPYTFRSIMEPIQGHSTLLPWIAQKYNLKTIALTSTDDETGLIQAEDVEIVAKKLGLTITDKAFAPRGTSDFAPMLTKLIAKKPHAIDFGAWAGSDGPLACKQAKELGYNGVMIFSYTQSLPTFEKVAAGFMDDVLFYGIFATDPTPLATKVAKRYEEKYKQKFDPLVWRNSDVLFVVKKAMETVQSIDPTAVKNAMPKVQIDGVFGRTRIGGKSYYGLDCQFLFPIPLSTYDGKLKKLVELHRGIIPPDY
jgi:branched-chain amino acid transport system substrate-binding protein